jgi:bisphosphoglycerate-independent phosphoglycerate mutase (AlkP superfamily)
MKNIEKNSNEGSGEVADNKEVTETVVYHGLADSHTIEVKKGDKVISMQFDPERLEEIQALEEGKEINVMYRENEKKQLELIEIIR